MIKQVKRRMVKICLALVIIIAGVFWFLGAMRDNIVFFVTPSELSVQNIKGKVKIGGFVKQGSVKQYEGGTYFVLTDRKQEVGIRYSGMLPVLFRENQGIIAQGRLGIDKEFIAEKLLAKHDEYYHPPRKNNDCSVKDRKTAEISD